MMNSKKFFKMAKKSENSAATIRKGHFIIYTADQKPFSIPLKYLNRNVFVELLRLSEEEFGFQTDGPITLPYDASFMEYIVLLIERGVTKDLEQKLLMAFATSFCSSVSLLHEETENYKQAIACCN